MRAGVVARVSVAVVAVCGIWAASGSTALADGWLPHGSDATWSYQWSDSQYSPTPLTENFTVDKSSNATAFTLDWTGTDTNGPNGTSTDQGNVSFQQTDSGLFNTNWSSAPPPTAFPILCATAAQCGNSLAGAFYNVIWGARSPMLFEPLLQGTTWTTTGGAANDVTSSNTYMGTQQVTVPAFPNPVTAAVVQSQITQAGAIGDPYGSGERTTWWVYNVGPVKVVFKHAGGQVTTVELESTNQTAAAPPTDTDYFPMTVGFKGKYEWTNPKYLTKPEVESYTIDQAANDTAIVKVASVSGPLKVAGAYQFTLRTEGLTSVASAVKAASLAKFPPLGPKSAPASQRRHFFTPFDLMTFGFNPVIPAYPAVGNMWASDPNSRDFDVYGVTGSTRVVGIQKVTVPAGTFQALVVASTLKQPGFPFGSGTRTSWFAPGKGLVKLVFRHGDGSVSTVQLVK
ncbi:MAG: hypothetical protein JOY72_03785 [Actinobacteria bacterium]|nr:hypothetical protein [Actinomycetota bacterium]